MRTPENPPGEPSSASDTQRLVEAARAGDAARFAELYERIAPALYTWACLRIRPAMRAFVDPEDVVQEVWCRAWKAFANFDPAATGFRAWIFRIAKNVLLEAFRKLQRSSTGAGSPGPSTRLFQLQNVPDSATNISRRMSRHEGIAVVLRFVEGLDEDDKLLFVHCGLEGLTYAEASERLQIHRETIAKRWQSLRERIATFGVPKDLLIVE